MVHKISIITAVYNAENFIEDLIRSLRSQTYKNFEWIVVDGASTDKTLEILNDIKDLNIIIISESDFGIYDALNKGIKKSSGEYYLVLGADDKLFESALEIYSNSIIDNADIITANILNNNRVIAPNIGPAWRSGMFHWISQHSVGTLIRKSLHNKYGYYSSKFPIAADQLFIKSCAVNGASFLSIKDIVGEFGSNGVSSTDKIGGLSEYYRIQLITGENKLIQTILFFARLTKVLLSSKNNG
ncbi:glycosyltransferase family 2 protein [Acinetobacter schindleri]|uniref:glycosyltransferase family 2 protein n=1 Tax=Acinetobacter schindleri TaxID=108981 RepID=UPI003F550BED